MKIYLLPVIGCVLLIACNSNADDNIVQEDTVQTGTKAPEASADVKTINASFPQLFTYFSRQDSSFSPGKFELNELVTIDSSQSYSNSPKLKAFYPYFIYNGDSTLAIDLFSYSYEPVHEKGGMKFEPGGPDSEVALVDVKKNSRKRILFSGPSVVVLDARWLNDKEIIVAGAEDIGNGKLRPILWKVNLVANSLQLYNYPDSIQADVNNYIEQKLQIT